MNVIPLEENCVRYCLYSNQIHEEDAEQSQLYLNQLLATVSGQVLAYKWNYVPFHLRFITQTQSHNQIEHFEGLSNFDENIEDEWFIVHLLFELSRKDDSLVIQVQDTDGEFLLIETADQLPRWVKPESVENRHFIHKGKLHLINRSDWPGNISLNETRKAIEYVRANADKTMCDERVQQQIDKRIGDYPGKISKLNHKARLTVPAKVAALVDARPQLISHAVRAFNCRDEQDLVFCRQMQHFGPIDLVQINVSMTKFNYAQLIGQELKPDKRLQWPNTPGSDKSRDLGFKLSCGFEILLSTFEQKQPTDQTTCCTDNSLNVRVDKRWQSFVQSLKSSGYFDELMENSKGYIQKLKEAKTYFMDVIHCEGNESEEAFFDPDFLAGKNIHELITHSFDSNTVDGERFRNEELSDEESDQWLNEPPDYFLEMENLSKQKQQLIQLGANIPEKLEEFIVKRSDHQGAVIPTEKKRTLKERALDMISDNLRSILTMKVSDSEHEDDSESGMSDYRNSSDDEEMAEGDEEEGKKEGRPVEKERKKRSKKMKETKLYRHEEEADEEMKDETGDEGAAGVGDEQSVLTIKELMRQMDQELGQTCMAQSFEQAPKAPLVSTHGLEEFDDSEDEECSIKATDGGSERGLMDDLSDVDVRFNAVKNILESFQSQNGLPGPSSNLLSSMGVHLPRDSDSVKKNQS